MGPPEINDWTWLWAKLADIAQAGIVLLLSFIAKVLADIRRNQAATERQLVKLEEWKVQHNERHERLDDDVRELRIMRPAKRG